MKKFVAYEKLSKKEKRKVDSKGRRLWSDYGCMSPACRKIPDKKKEKNRNLCREMVGRW